MMTPLSLSYHYAGVILFLNEQSLIIYNLANSNHLNVHSISIRTASFTIKVDSMINTCFMLKTNWVLFCKLTIKTYYLHYSNWCPHYHNFLKGTWPTVLMRWLAPMTIPNRLWVYYQATAVVSQSLESSVKRK